FGAGAAWGRRSEAAVQAAAPGGQTGQTGQGRAAGQGGVAGTGGQGRVAMSGTVDQVEGQTLLVTVPNNQQLKVTLTDQTRILKQVPGTVADIVAGARVTVTPQGQPAADGAVTAATVSIAPEGAGPEQSGSQGPPRQGRAPGQAGAGG
ncbi:MAG: hypothetical protein ACRDJN_00360, partial [Chloroflexota bacterium]